MELHYKKIMDKLEKNNGIVQSDIIKIDSNFIVENFDSPFFTVLFWDSFKDIFPALFKKYSSAIFDFLNSNYEKDLGWHFFPDKRDYPTDSDDTAVVARFLYSQKKITKKQTDSLKQLLRSNEDEIGNFFVWIKNGAKRKSNIVDPIVNINVNDFLLLIDSCNALNKDVVNNIEYYLSSSYYHTSSVSLWFIFNSKFLNCTNDEKEKIIIYLLKHKQLNIDYLSLNLILNNAFKCLPKTITIYNKTNIIWFKHSSSNIGYTCEMLEEFEKIKLINDINNLKKGSTVPNIVYK